MSGIGIDLGTSTTVVCHSAAGVLADEPTAVLQHADPRRRGRPVSVGAPAYGLLGRVPAGLAVTRPVQDGVVVDLDAARALARDVIRRTVLRPWVPARSQVAVAVPLGASDVECRAVLEAVEDVRLRNVRLVPAAVAGALASGVDLTDRRTHLVVDVGAGTCEIAAFAYGGVVAARSTRLGGDEMTLALHEYLRGMHQVVVGELTAEELKLRVATEESPSVVVEGQDAATGRPRLVALSVEEVLDAVRPVTDTIVQALAACLHDLPSQAVSDVAAEGVLAIGGVTGLRGFGKSLESALGFAVRVADRPLTCVAEGTAELAADDHLLKAFARS